MSNLAAKLKNATLGAPSTPAQVHWSIELCEEFAKTVNEKHGNEVRAIVKSAFAPGVSRLELRPTTRPNEAVFVFVLHPRGTQVAVLGTNERLFDADEFEAYLLDLYGSEDFAATVYELTRRNTEPAEAYLRFGAAYGDRSPAQDVFVRLETDAQRVMALAFWNAETKPISIVASIAGATPIAKGRSVNGAKWLMSAGIAVKLSEATDQGEGKIKLKGIVGDAEGRVGAK